MKKFLITLLIAVVSLVVIIGGARAIDTSAYKRGLWDGVKMAVENCYHSPDGAVILNGDTGHALLCQGVDTGIIKKDAPMSIYRPSEASGEPEGHESEQDRKKKEADPHQT